MSLSYGKDYQDDEEPVGRVLLPVRASTVKPRRLRWLWDSRIVVGGLTLLAGREGLGKSTVAGDLVAHVTRGELQGECHGEPASVLYITSEDSREYTVVPRLIAAQADLERVLFVDAQTELGEDRVVLPLDLDRLASLIETHEIALVVLDAATSVMDGKLDGDRDRQMRQALEPVGHVANRTGAAVLGIVHFGKRESSDTGKLILGSIAWSQVARSVLAVARDDETGDLVVSTTKANLAPGDTSSLSVRIVDTPVDTSEGVAHVGRVEWLGETERNARELLGSRDSMDDRTERDEAAEWLLGFLQANGGAASARDATKAAKADGIAERTLQRARSRAGVKSERQGFGQGATWSYDPDEADDGSTEPSAPHSRHPARAHVARGTNGADEVGGGADEPADESARPTNVWRINGGAA